jgi:membrane fusion protein (multidrug efflux system)
MGMNQFHSSEELLIGDSGQSAERETSVPEDTDLEDTDLNEEIGRLRIRLERLEAFQRSPRSDEPDSADETSDEDHPDQPSAPVERNQRRRPGPMRLLFVTIVAAILCVGGFRSWRYLESYQNTDDAEIDGYLDPISSRINGTVIAVHVDNNQTVKAGQLLVQLDPRDYQLAIEQARAQLAQAQADLNSARQNYVSAVATIREAQAQNYLARRNAERYSQLIRQNVVSQSEFDQYYLTARAQAATVKVDEAAAASA